TPKTGIKKQTTQARQEDGESPHKDGHNKQKPPNTLLSSQTTDLLLLPDLGQPCQLITAPAKESNCLVGPFPGNPTTVDHVAGACKLHPQR
ncbi:MAG: hypothetical protein ACSLE6_17080, partial [Mycobacterium sp.]